MRENNHILSRNTYKDLSSYKIHQPLQDKFYPSRGNELQDYGSQENNIKLSKFSNSSNTLCGYYFNHSKKPVSVYEDRSHNQSRDLSYQSKGSNLSKNSIKMSDYVALQAKNILLNKQKFKYEGEQNHGRSSSMQYYPKTSIKLNSKHQLSTVQKNDQPQPCQIPSFGVECRSTMSAYDKPPTVIHHHTNSSYYNNLSSHSYLKDATPYQLRNQRLKSQIDQRIQRLRVSSNSTQHKQRLNSIKVLDANRIQNMDKINIKIKNILKTLQNEQDHYKRKFTTQGDCLLAQHHNNSTNNRRLRTIAVDADVDDSNVYGEGIKYSMTRVSGGIIGDRQQRRLRNDNRPYHNSQIVEKCHPQRRQLFFNPNSSSNLTSTNTNTTTKSPHNDSNNKKYDNLYHPNYRHHPSQESFQNNTIQNYQNINVSSYYYYDDDQAILKSSQSPIKSSPEKGFNKYSLSKYGGDMNKDKRKSVERKYQNKEPIIGSYKLSYPSSKLSTNNPHSMNKQSSILSLYNNNYSYKTDNTNLSILNNIPECQTEIIQSKALDNINHDHTFQSNRQQYDEYQKEMNNNIKLSDNIVVGKEAHRRDNSVYLKVKTQENKVGKMTIYNQKELNIGNKRTQQYSLSTIPYQLHQQSYKLKAQNLLSIKPNQPNYFYSDSIKETPRIQQRSDRFHQQVQPINNQRKVSYQKRSESYSHQNDQLQNKLKSYQKRIQNYHRDLSASKLLNSQLSKSYNNIQKSLSNRSFLNFDDKSLSNHASAISQRIVSDLKRQKTIKQKQQKPPKQSTSKERDGRISLQHQSKKPKSPRPSHRFAKQDHQKFIDSLRKERQQIASLSKRKSMDLSRLSPSPFQRSNQRSQSDNSRISSVTIVKGKNVDAEIEKFQKKMEHYEQLKKELHLSSQQNTKRSASQNRENPNVKLDQNYCNSLSKRQSKKENIELSSRVNSIQRREELLKIVAEENSYVKVRKSIIKEHKTTQLKNYLNEELKKGSNPSQSACNNERMQSSLQKKMASSQIKENIIPTSTSSLRSNETQSYPKSPLGQKKVILGLAQNLVNYQNQVEKSQVKLNGQTEDDVNTPKLLRNLKNKVNDKSIVKKRAEKRGFRSQFINDLHEDNEVIYSAKKNEQQFEDPISSTSRLRSQCKETLCFILSKLEQQILRDEKFRNEKKLFNAMTEKDKWSDLMNEYIKLTGDKRVSLSEIMEMFTLTEDESNPFYSTRGNEFTFSSLVQCHLSCEQNWISLTSHISQLSFSHLQQCGLNLRNLDIQKKGYIDIEDLTRFLNMEMNKYYRKRDLYLLWRRIHKNMTRFMSEFNEEKVIQNLFIQQLLSGLGADQYTA